MPSTEADLTSSATTIDCLRLEDLTEVLLRIPTPAALVHASAVSRSWRGAIARREFLVRYRKRHKSSPFLGIYITTEVTGTPKLIIPDSIRFPAAAASDRDLKHAAHKAFDYDDVHRYQDHRLHNVVDNAFILGHLGVHSDFRLLDCHNSQLLLTRSDEALEVRSPLARESILLPFPPHDFHQACLLQGHDGSAASFRVVYLQHRREGRNRHVRAVEYDSTRKSWQKHPWHTIKEHIEGRPEEVMHAGHRMFCRYRGQSHAALMLDTRKMEFRVLALPTDRNFAIGEIEDNVCCLVESIDRRWFKVWKLEEEKQWKLEKDVSLDQVLAKHVQNCVGYYRPCAISNGIALMRSTTPSDHFVFDLNTCSLMGMFEFEGRSAYIMQMPWPPAFSHSTVNGGFDHNGEPASVVDAKTGAGALDEIEGLLGGAPALAEEPMHLDTCQTQPSSGFSTDPSPLLSLEENHRAQVLSTGQVPAEFAVPKPDANMAEASEGAERMHKGGLNQESEADGQKQDKERPPTRRVDDAKEHKRERDRARHHAMSLEEMKRRRETDRGGHHAMSLEKMKRKRERERTRWHAMCQERRNEKNKRCCEAYMIKLKQQPNIRNRNDGDDKSNKEMNIIEDTSAHTMGSLMPAAGGFDRDGGPAAVGDARTGSGKLDTIEGLIGGTLATALPATPAVEQLSRVRSRSQSLNHDLMLPPPTFASCKQQGGFDHNGEPASVVDARTGAGIEGILGGASAFVEEPAHVDPCQGRPEPSPNTSCRSQDTAPAIAPPTDLLTTSSPAECMENRQEMALTTAGSPSCPQQGRKQWAGSSKSKGSPEPMGLGRRNWKPKSKYLGAIFGLRRRQSFSIISKNHRAQVLSRGQVPAEFAVPKPDANMAEASEGAERMHKDCLNQESEADGQKQDKESPPNKKRETLMPRETSKDVQPKLSRSRVVD